MKTIEEALDEAYKNAGSNAYFGNGFKAGAQFAIDELVSKFEQLKQSATTLRDVVYLDGVLTVIESMKIENNN